MVLPFVLIVLISIFLIRKPNQEKTNINSPNNPVSENQPTPSPFKEFTTSFEIYTLGTKRIFTDSRYPNQSDEVYITASDPNGVIVKKEGITWADFFATLPMKLEKDCITTGTGQVFCTNDTNSLKFYINDSENPNALDEGIKEGNKLRIVYE